MSNLFIKFDGVDGDVTEKSHQGWSQIQSAQFVIERHTCTKIGNAQDRVKGHPAFSYVTIIKSSDSTTNKFLQLVLKASVIKKVEIDFCNDQGESLENIQLADVLIAHFDKTLGHAGVPMETLKLDFTSIQHTYTKRDNQNTLTSPFTSGYDLLKAAVK